MIGILGMTHHSSNKHQFFLAFCPSWCYGLAFCNNPPCLFYPVWGNWRADFASVILRIANSPDKPLSGELRRTSATMAIVSCEHGIRTAAVTSGNKPSQNQTKTKTSTTTFRISKKQTNEIEEQAKNNSIVRILDALSPGDLPVASPHR